MEKMKTNSIEFRDQLQDAILNKNTHLIEQMVKVKKRKVEEVEFIEGFGELLMLTQVIDEEDQEEETAEIIIKDKDFYYFIQKL